MPKRSRHVGVTSLYDAEKCGQVGLVWMLLLRNMPRDCAKSMRGDFHELFCVRLSRCSVVLQQATLRSHLELCSSETGTLLF